MLVKKYTDFSMSRVGMRTDFIPGPSWDARFKLDNDIRRLFPYINSVLPGSRYHEKPEYIQFTMEGIICTLFPNEVLAAPFLDREQAVKFAEEIIGFINSVDARKDNIKPNYKKLKSGSVLDIFKILPGTNCGDCGYPTCMAFAAALMTNRTTSEKCPGFVSPIAESALYPVYDNEGRLTGTVSLDIDTDKIRRTRDSQAKYIEKLKQKLAEEQGKTERPVEDDSSDVLNNLTEREIQVLRLMAEGATNTEISEVLSISPHTVKSHVVNIFNKLGVNDRTKAAVWAARHNIV